MESCWGRKIYHRKTILVLKQALGQNFSDVVDDRLCFNPSTDADVQTVSIGNLYELKRITPGEEGMCVTKDVDGSIGEIFVWKQLQTFHTVDYRSG